MAASSSTLTGLSSGLYNIPTAKVIEDGHFYLGAAYIKDPYAAPYRNINNNIFAEKGSIEKDGRSVFLGVGLLPNLEISIRVMYLGEDTFFPDEREVAIRGADRALGWKYQLLSEQEHFIDFAFGSNDFLSINSINLGEATNASHFHSNYLVLGKTIGNFIFTIGTSKRHRASSEYSGGLDGCFYGAEWKLLNNLSLIYEYDTFFYNTGLRYFPFKEWKVDLLLMNNDKPAFSIAYEGTL
ncbi:MAG: YjbH domain-containing protein [Candidatus Margulisbacteria bacterium]|nr:YjbH domain-containing protein [Candidatus Margulisiibacteriota bacterium]